MNRKCEFCGQPFEAKRARARFCSGTCRAKASQRRKREGGPEPVQVVIDAGSDASRAGSLAACVAEALSEAGEDGWRARQAIEVARRLETPGESGAATLSKELDRIMGELLGGDEAAKSDALDELQSNVVPMRRRRA